jgi:PAS domain-containing protein
MDITERKHVEDKIREQEAELRQILDATPQHLIPEFVVSQIAATLIGLL